MKDDLNYLRHIVEAIISIEQFTAKMDYEKFKRNKMASDAVLMNFAVIGEVAGKVSKEFQKNYPEGGVV